MKSELELVKTEKSKFESKERALRETNKTLLEEINALKVSLREKEDRIN